LIPPPLVLSLPFVTVAVPAFTLLAFDAFAFFSLVVSIVHGGTFLS
jgi:hypothetical protein